MNADRPSSLFRFPNKLSGLQIGRAPFAQARLCLIPWIREKGFSTHANEPNDNWSFQLNNNRPDRR